MGRVVHLYSLSLAPSADLMDASVSHCQYMGSSSQRLKWSTLQLNMALAGCMLTARVSLEGGRISVCTTRGGAQIEGSKHRYGLRTCACQETITEATKATVCSGLSGLFTGEAATAAAVTYIE